MIGLKKVLTFSWNTHPPKYPYVFNHSLCKVRKYCFHDDLVAISILIIFWKRPCCHLYFWVIETIFLSRIPFLLIWVTNNNLNKLNWIEMNRGPRLNTFKFKLTQQKMKFKLATNLICKVLTLKLYYLFLECWNSR